MNLKYVKGSYMDEIMYEGRPVLFTLDGLEEGHEEELKAVLNEESAPTVLNAFKEKLADMDEVTPEAVKKAIKAVMKETSLKGKFVFMPLRVALTGQMHGPDLNNIVTLLGKEKCLHHLDNVGALTK